MVTKEGKFKPPGAKDRKEKGSSAGPRERDCQKEEGGNTTISDKRREILSSPRSI